VEVRVPSVRGLFADREQAVGTLEALRAARFDTERVRLVGGPDHPGELASDAGPGTAVAAGPASAVAGGLLQGAVSEDELQSIGRRLSEGAVLLLSDDLDATAAEQLVQVLRERGAEQVASSSL
jgi:hypothetical protein